MQNRTVLFLSLPLSALIIFVSCVGLLTPGFYSTETLNWQAQATWQDMIDLFLIVPCLLITSILAYRNNSAATMVWGGVVLYLTYTFVLYCFDIHFNKLFVIYCLCLGLSFYSFMYFLFRNYTESKNEDIKNKRLIRIIAIYFILVSVIFYSLWLAEIIPSIIKNTIPRSLAETGLFTNGVHVIDLAVFLPAVFITGVFLLKGKSLGFILTPVMLTFFVLMDITIGMLVVVMKTKGIESNLTLTLIMGAFALISLILLIWYCRSVKNKT
ncbi:MAG: hypothetical protein JWQ40_4114 [Segetibacter sp.]|nr:hypothetical protein [Segetibacter sp.]